jgi:hypothetical protein
MKADEFRGKDDQIGPCFAEPAPVAGDGQALGVRILATLGIELLLACIHLQVLRN